MLLLSASFAQSNAFLRFSLFFPSFPVSRNGLPSLSHSSLSDRPMAELLLTTSQMLSSVGMIKIGVTALD